LEEKEWKTFEALKGKEETTAFIRLGKNKEGLGVFGEKTVCRGKQAEKTKDEKGKRRFAEEGRNGKTETGKAGAYINRKGEGAGLQARGLDTGEGGGKSAGLLHKKKKTQRRSDF